MSIASRIESIENHIEEAYTEIARLGVDLTNVNKNIDNIADTLQEAYDNQPKVSDIGSNVNLSNTRVGGLSITPLGACEQDSDPTPDYPQNIRVVTGDNEVVIQNKNLYLGYTNMTSGFIPQSGSYPTSNPSFPLSKYQLIELKQGKSITLSNSTSGIGRVRYIDKETNLVVGTITQASNEYYTSTAQYVDGFREGTITANKDIILGILLTQIDTSPLMIEYGSTATTYAPHAEQSTTLHLGSNYLAGIGDYKDKIVGYTDNWKIVRYVGKKVANNITTTGTTNVHIDTTFNDYLNQNGLCNYLTNKVDSRIVGNYDAGVYLENNEFTFRDGTTKDRLYIKSTLTATELNALEMEVYYLLATPTEETITDNQLITDLNNMYQLLGYDGTTNITITSNSANAQMTATISALKGE